MSDERDDGLTEPVAHPVYRQVHPPVSLEEHVIEAEAEHAGQPSDDTSLEEAAWTPGTAAPDPRHAQSDEG